MAKVLLVDDDKLVRNVVRVVLEAEGHTVREAADGEGALEVADAFGPDVVVLDLVIPGTDAFGVCRRLKAAGSGAKVLVLTGLPEEEFVDNSLEAGADDLMTKPFSALDLLRRVSLLAGEPG